MMDMSAPGVTSNEFGARKLGYRIRVEEREVLGMSDMRFSSISGQCVGMCNAGT